MKKKRSSIYTLVQYIIVILAILMTGGIWLRWVFKEQTSNIAGLLLILWTLIYIFMKVAKGAKLEKRTADYILLVFFFMIAIVVTRPNYMLQAITSVYFPYITILLLAGITNNSEKKNFAIMYVRIIVLISTVSLVFYLLGTVLGIIQSNGLIEVVWDDARNFRNFYFLHFDSRSWQPIDIFGLSGIRNTSIFTESPMFGFCLILAYLLNRSYLSNTFKYNLVLLITVFTTFSTTAIIAVACFEGFCFMFVPLKNKYINLLKNICLPIVVVIIIVTLDFVLNQKTGTGSYLVRMDHWGSCWKVLKNNFWCGCGFGNQDGALQYAVFKQGASIGLLFFAAQGGLISLMLVLIPYFHYLNRSVKRKDIKGIGVIIGVTVVLMMTNIFLISRIQWYLLCLLFWGRKDNDEKRLENFRMK